MIQGSNHGPPSRRFSLLDTSWRHRIVSLLLQHVTQCGSGSVVEHLLAKEKVAGSNPVFRSEKSLQNQGKRLPQRVAVCRYLENVAILWPRGCQGVSAGRRSMAERGSDGGSRLHRTLVARSLTRLHLALACPHRPTAPGQSPYRRVRSLRCSSHGRSAGSASRGSPATPRSAA